MAMENPLSIVVFVDGKICKTLDFPASRPELRVGLRMSQ
jgi:hypothetical protein